MKIIEDKNYNWIDISERAKTHALVRESLKSSIDFEYLLDQKKNYFEEPLYFASKTGYEMDLICSSSDP